MPLRRNVYHYRRPVIPPPIVIDLPLGSVLPLDAYVPGGPRGSSTVTVECWGGGGGGIAASGATASGGGGGGAYAIASLVGATLGYQKGDGGLVYAGKGGIAGTLAAEASWATATSNPANYFVFAAPGVNSAGVSGGKGGLKENCVGDVANAGGNGSVGFVASGGAGGGSGAAAGAGGDASSTTGGTAKPGGGKGGNVNVAANSPGGGGGGNDGGTTGGNSGGYGKTKITITLPEVVRSFHVFTTPATYLLDDYAPTGTTSIAFQCWGGGGGSGGSTVGPGGSGGGGTAYATKTVSYTKGSNWSLVVGAGGSSQITGSDSKVLNGASVVVLAQGGTGGSGPSVPGSGGTAAGSTGDTKYSGGAGVAGVDSTHAGGGGGAAGTDGAGNDASSTSGGVAGLAGGPGGNGATVNMDPGNAGGSPGGGGGGPGGGGVVSGTSGGNGKIIISW